MASYEPAGKPGTAEIAFAVPDHLHHRGIATLLLEHLVSIARQRRVKAFTAETLAENTAMLRCSPTPACRCGARSPTATWC